MPFLLASLTFIGGAYVALKIKNAIKSPTLSKSLSHQSAKQKLNTKTISQEQSPTEIYARQQQYIAVTALVFTSLGILINPVISFAAIPLITYNYLALMREVRDAYNNKGKMVVVLLDVFCVTLSFLMGNLWIITLLLSILFSARRLNATIERQTEADYSRIFGELSNMVWLLREDIEIEVALSDVQLNDVIVVHAGEMIPVDGRLVAGEGLIDQHLLTGESQPVEKKVGDKVLTSTLLISGTVQVRVEQHGSETITGQIALALEQASAYKQQMQSRGEQLVEKGATKILIVCGAAAPFIPFSQVVALSFSGFGYQMRAAAPLMVFNYLRLAFQQSIIIKDGRALDNLYSVDTVIFDKTGTLTEEMPQIEQIISCGELSESKLLQYTASAEQRQQHPIGLAICAYAKQQQIDFLTLNNSDYAIGHGLRAELHAPEHPKEKYTLLIGSRHFINQLAITIPESIETVQNEANEKGHSVVYVAAEIAPDNTTLLGIIELAPVLRPQAQETIATLHQLGIKTAIISGDQQKTTQHLAMQLGIDDYFAETLPKDKAKIVADLQNEGHTVCFIGDGINDSVALQQADVAISLHGAAIIAQDTADIVLLTPDLSYIPWLLHLSRDLHKRMDRNEYMNNAFGATCVVSVLGFGMGLGGAMLLYTSGMALSISNAMLPWLNAKLTRKTKQDIS